MWTHSHSSSLSLTQLAPLHAPVGVWVVFTHLESPEGVGFKIPHHAELQQVASQVWVGRFLGVDTEITSSG